MVVTVAGGAGASTILDLRTRRIPNWLTLSLTACGLTLAALQVSGLSLFGALAGFGLGLVLMLPGHVVGATGAGDVKLFAAMGTVLGPSGIAVAFFYTTIVGGVLALVVAINRRRLRDTVERTAAFVSTGGANVGEIEGGAADNRFAYAPAIALGTLAVALGL